MSSKDTLPEAPKGVASTDSSKKNPQDLTIIGIGSSAGGLEAIRELVSTLPTELPVSYVVVQHMSPHHKSLMTELVLRHTALKVKDVTDGTVPQRNVVYITPPKTDIIMQDGKLRLVEMNSLPSHPRPSVDRFLLSLAESHGDKSVAIILSGTGSDGAYGIQGVREAGGITIAQTAETAKYDGMPWSAIQTGCVDLVLSPQDIGTHLQKILNSKRDFSEFRRSSMDDSPYSDLLHILLARTRVDFRDYKQTTVGRRIERRMVALGIESQEEYANLCRNTPNAVDALFKDLLISVTRFFRDKEEFEQLEDLLPEILEDRGEQPLRVWIAGCATGEEAYSIAMLLSEAVGGSLSMLKNRLQIFATDIDKDALQVARAGIYGAAALNDIPAGLAKKYMVAHQDGVRVVDSLRQAILFSDHNVCQDPPFQKLDLICCRNLLIYFGTALQRRVLGRFHFVMNPSALLFLGTAENINGSDQLFAAHRDAAHVFRKRVLRSNRPGSYSMPNPPSLRNQSQSRDVAKEAHAKDREFFDALVRSLGQNSILVTEDYAIVSVFGDVSAYIEIKDTSSLKMHIDLLRRPFRDEARSLVTIALRNQKRHSGVRHLLAPNEKTGTRLDVFPILPKGTSENAVLVVFNEIDIDQPEVKLDHDLSGTDDAVAHRIRALEHELASSREALQQTIEELETSNEELQSLNEELQSTNEELQATNEELETSNEELQSTNEELITVNEELQVTAAELTGRTGELTSVLQTTPLAIIVTDNALQITQATHAATELFGLQSPISNPHISQSIMPEGYPPLAPLCNQALTLGQTVIREFDTATARIKLSFTPYFDINGRILGVTLAAAEFPGISREMEMIMDASHVYLMNRSRDGEILRISDTAARLLGLTREEAIGKNYYELLDSATATAMRRADQEVLHADRRHSFAKEELFRDRLGNARWQTHDRFRFAQRGDTDFTIYSIATDITDAIEVRDAAQELTVQILLLQDMAHIGFWSIDLTTRDIHWSKEVFRIHRTTPEEYVPVFDTAVNFYHPDDIDDVLKEVERVRETGGEFLFHKRLLCKSEGKPDEVVYITSHGLAVKNEFGKTVKVVGVFTETPPPKDD